MTPQQIEQAKTLINTIEDMSIDTVMSEEDVDYLYESQESILQFLKELIK